MHPPCAGVFYWPPPALAMRGARHDQTVDTGNKDTYGGGAVAACGFGVVGLQRIEAVVLGALISAEPLLLIGPHGTGKSYLLARLCVALGLEWRHYNASLLNFDDLVGYPLPDGRGGLEYVQTPSSIWQAEAVFVDKSRAVAPTSRTNCFRSSTSGASRGLPSIDSSTAGRR